MKSFTSIAVLSVFAMPFLAQAGDYDACKPVFEACAAQGFTKDEAAPAGKKIWLNCASQILEHSKAVPTVDLDPQGEEAKVCREYREAKAQFDADFAKKHKKTMK